MRVDSVGVLLLLVCCCSCAVKTLVVVDSHDMQLTHSAFFSSLRARGHELTIMEAQDPELSLEQYGTFQYDNLILFSPAADELGGAVDVNSILQFVDSGRNLLLAGALEAPGAPLREVAAESGIIFDSEGLSVIDHQQYDQSDFGGDHTLVLASNFAKIPSILGTHPLPPVLFEGTALRIDQDNRLAFGVLFGSASSYTGRADLPAPAEQLRQGGTNTVLVAALQARNNARVVVSGSIDLFSDRFYGQPVGTMQQPSVLSGNDQLASQLSGWCFGEKGRLRATQVSFNQLPEGPPNPTELRVRDTLRFGIKLEESIAGEWMPFIASDVQLEVVQLETKLRLELKPNELGVYETEFTVPDQAGVYQLRVNYLRRGYSAIEVAQQLTVRPFRHDEFERFVVAAFPYYVSSFAMMAGTFVFGGFFLYSKPKLS